MRKSLEKYNQFLHFVAYKHELTHDELISDFDEFCKEEKDNIVVNSIEDEFKNFMDANETQLADTYMKENEFQTSVRGLKIRGCYPTQGEAELRCKMLRDIDPNHDVYVGPVGMWMPFHPEAYKTGRVEYLESELNQLMHEKQNNEQHAKVQFEKRMRETKQNAIEENKKKAVESGNLLSQTIDKRGELINLSSINGLDETSSTEDIKKQLFEGENIVMDTKNSDHGLSNLK